MTEQTAEELAWERLRRLLVLFLAMPLPALVDNLVDAWRELHESFGQPLPTSELVTYRRQLLQRCISK